MPARIRSIIAVCVFSAVALQCAWLAAFPLRRWLAHEAMAEQLVERLPDSKLVRLSFTCPQVEAIAWERDGKELEHEGRMYDVVRSTRDAIGNLVLYCVDDARETRLMAGLAIAIRSAYDASGQQRSTSGFVLMHLAKACPDKAHRLSCAPCGITLRHGIPNVVLCDRAFVIEPPPPRA